MRQITPYLVWIGHAGNGRDFKGIFDLGIRAVVQLAAEEAPIQLPRELLLFRYPMLDGTGNDLDILDLAIGNVTSLLQKRIPVLVCCSAGMSRSPTIVAAALSSIRSQGFDESLSFVVAGGPADISPGFCNEVKRAFTKRDKRIESPWRLRMPRRN